MSHRREFEIAFVGLKPGIHDFNYIIDDKFFEAFQQQNFRNSKVEIKLKLDKKSSFMMLKFEVGGTVEVVCDRCNNTLPLDLWDEFNITLKMVEEPELMNDQETDPDIFYISQVESHFDITNWVFEFINLSIPILKVCTYENMEGPFCNKKVLKLLKKMEPEEPKNKENPIWKGLDKFKNLGN